MRRLIVPSLFCLVSVASPVLAGGYERVGQNVDTLFDAAQFVFDSRVAFVSPQFTYASVTSPTFGTATGVKPDLDVFLPRFDVKAGWGDADCLGSYSIPYGSSVKYDENWVGRLDSIEKKLEDRQLAFTCSYAVDAGPGALRVIAGLSYDMATYDQKKNYTALSGSPGFPGTVPGARWIPTLNLEGEGVGWRVGVGYEIPEYAVRATLMYYSAIDIRATGAIADLPVPGIGRIPNVPVYADATIPQSLELKLQSGVAPGWLVFGSVKWTDWSVWQRVDIRSQATNGLVTWLDNYFRDGWTVNLGVGHQFTDKLAGQVGITWDQGVGTGWTEHTDTWSLSAGARYALTENLDVYGGVAATLITGGAVTLPSPMGATGISSSWNDNWSFAGQIGLKAHF